MVQIYFFIDISTKSIELCDKKLNYSQKSDKITKTYNIIQQRSCHKNQKYSKRKYITFYYFINNRITKCLYNSVFTHFQTSTKPLIATEM